MGWLWGSGDTPSAGSNLDPSLQDFLNKEAPTGPKPSLPSRPAEKPKDTAQPAPAQPEVADKPHVPPQSQFQDGRYAHLWKGYVPQNELENRSKSEQDRLKDIIDSFNGRKAEIGQVALENCSFEYLEQYNCFMGPKTTWQMASLCRTESRKFNRCYDMQQKFLKALGYLSMEARTAEDSERIQMHADKLYQQMIEQEALIAKAKEEGREPPKFESVLSQRNVARVLSGKPSAAKPPTGHRQLDDDELWKLIKPETREQYEKALAELPPVQRDVEKQAMLGEMRVNIGQAKQVQDAFMEERINRLKRREAGQATIGDAIKRIWGWDRDP